jgi:uncharacterized protein (TIRG00374 family)
MKNHFLISLLAGLALSVAAIYFAFRNVPFHGLLNYLASINYIWVIPAVVLVLVSFFLRAARWQVILGSNSKIGIWAAFHPMMIGFMINCILPGRVGEVARPIILQKKEKVPFATGIATVAAERLFDVGFLIIFAVITLANIQIDPQADIVFGSYRLNRATLETIFSGIIQMGLLLIFVMIMISISKIRKVIHGIIMAIPALLFFTNEPVKTKITQKVCKPLTGFVDNIALGFTLIKYPKKIGIIAMYSFLIWFIAAISWYIFGLGCPGIELTFAEMFAVMIIICLFIALPSVPGFWGLWEAGGVFGMSLFGVSAQAAAGFTLANHAIQMFPVIIVGIISAIITSVNILQVSYQKEQLNDKLVEQ